jgi:hypothetical protein
MTRPRTFPTRLTRLPADALDSWLEAIAFRRNVPLSDLLSDLGLSTRNKSRSSGLAAATDWTIALRGGSAARAVDATGMAAAIRPRTLTIDTTLKPHGE